MTALGVFLILYGITTLTIAILKPKPIWQIGKIQGFVQVLTERGTVIFFVIVGLAALGGGIAILL